MKLSTRYQMKGMLRVVKGSVKEMAGTVSSNTLLGVKGKVERLTGKVQWKIGKAQGLVGL
jgi:uncharacterized protein YjbJ (UPF0337 family)